jgi:hypothetical protein
MNFAGNADVSQESDVFRAMAKRFNTTPLATPPPVRASVFGKASPKASPKPQPQSMSLPDMGSIGIYVLSGLILGGTFMLSRGSSPSPRAQQASLPTSISIGGMNLDI